METNQAPGGVEIFRRVNGARRRTGALVAALLLPLALAVVNPAPAAAAGDDYPFKTATVNSPDGWGFSARHCTSFVAWRLNQALGTPQVPPTSPAFSNSMNGGMWSNAEHWNENAAALGYAVDSAPRVGSIAHWDPNEKTFGKDGSWFQAGSIGHVAYVTAVDTDGTVSVEQYNGNNAFAYSTGTGMRGGRYIHVADQERPFIPLPPVRILDTRPGASGIVADERNTPIGAGETVEITIGGRGGVPAGVGAVALNVTVVGPTTPGWLAVYPSQGTVPNVSNLNFVAGDTVANMVISQVGANGKVKILNGQSAGAVDVLFDVIGYAPQTSTAYRPLFPTRIVDTRVDGGRSNPVPAGGDISPIVAGVAGVSPTEAAAVVLNVTVVDPANAGYVTVWPAGAPIPNASNLNFVAGQTVPNLVIAKLGTDGKISARNASAGSLHLILDVVGYIRPGTAFATATPARLLDTRSGQAPADDGFGAPVAANQEIALLVLGRGPVPAAGVDAVVINVTVVDPAQGGYLTVWPSGAALPNASTLNFRGNQTVPNLVIAKVGADGKVKLKNASGGAANLVADVVGWIAS